MTIGQRISAAILIGGVSTASHAQLCDQRVVCSDLDASGALVLDEPGTNGYTSDFSGFTPDRRPIAVIQPFSGRPRTAENPLGFRVEFNNCRDANQNGKIDAEEWILNEFQAAWDAGFRRFIINRPGGMLADNETDGTNFVPQESFEHLANWRKEIYVEAVAGWFSEKLAIDPAAQLGVFIGSKQNNACDPCHVSTAGGGVFDCSDTNQSDTREMNAAVRRSAELTLKSTRPWMEAGFNAFWFDATSSTKPLEFGLSEPDTILAMQDNPDYSSVKIAGEALPLVVGPNRQRLPAMKYIENAAWIGTQRFFEMTKVSQSTFDPASTEVVAAFIRSGSLQSGRRPHPPFDIQTIAGYRDRGFVLASWGDFAQRFIQRVDDSLDHTVTPAQSMDFDASGKVDCDDWAQFHTNWSANLNKGLPDPALWDGDLDDDGDVDTADRQLFEKRWRFLTGLRCGD